jgi:hypothetical protein
VGGSSSPLAAITTLLLLICATIWINKLRMLRLFKSLMMIFGHSCGSSFTSFNLLSEFVNAYLPLGLSVAVNILKQVFDGIRHDLVVPFNFFALVLGSCIGEVGLIATTYVSALLLYQGVAFIF